MNLAILSNAEPPDKASNFRRGASLARLLLAVGDRELAQTAEPGGALSVFVDHPSSWPRPANALRFREAGEMLATRLAENPDWVWIDFDPSAGSVGDRLDFLRLAATVAASVEAGGGGLGVAIPDDVGALGDATIFSGRSFSSRRILQRLVERCSRQVTFSTAAATKLSKRFRRGFELVPVPSLIPASKVTRGKARSELGLAEDSQDLLIGLMGRYLEMEWELLNAGLREALRLSPGARTLYLGPDGQRMRGRSIPMPLLDAGTPAPSHIAMKLRAVDLMILPLRDGGRADDQAILSCLCNGTPLVATAAGTGMDPAFGDPPEGCRIVPWTELGSYLEAIEGACERASRGTGGEVEEGLQTYYSERFSAGEMWRKLLGLNVASRP